MAAISPKIAAELQQTHCWKINWHLGWIEHEENLNRSFTQCLDWPVAFGTGGRIFTSLLKNGSK
jgi:hypothetical protein